MGSSIDMGCLIPVVVIMLLFGVSTAIVLVILHFNKKKMAALAEALGGQVKGRFDQTYVSIYRNQVECQLSLTMATDKSPSYLSLRLMAAPGFELYVAPKDFLDKAFDYWGGGDDLKIGVPEFDDKFEVKTDNEARALGILMDANKRAAVLQFFTDSFDRFDMNLEAAEVRRPDYDALDLDPQRIEEWVQRLMKIAL